MTRAHEIQAVALVLFNLLVLLWIWHEIDPDL